MIPLAEWLVRKRQFRGSLWRYRSGTRTGKVDCRVKAESAPSEAASWLEGLLKEQKKWATHCSPCQASLLGLLAKIKV